MVEIGHADVSTLRDFTQKEDFTQLQKPVLGWLVSSTKSRSRRAVAVAGTPGVTPTVSVQGTPTLIPSASTDMRRSSNIIKISVTPTKSIPIMVQTSAIVPPTTLEPTTTSSTKTTQLPTTGKPIINQKPEIVDKYKFEVINAVEQAPLLFDVPVGLFRDEGVLSIKLLYKKFDWVEDVPQWIAYREQGRKIFIFPENANAGEHYFALKAEDIGGLVAQHTFKVFVSKDQKVYNFGFNVTVDMDFDELQSNPIRKVELLNKIGTVMGYSDVSRMKNVAFKKGSVIVSWSDEQFVNSTSCNDPEFSSFVRRLDDDSRLAEEMLPYNLVSTGMTSKTGDCIITPLADEEDESLWERILIPVIVIVIILLIIALILCCVYRRKKKYETHSDKDETYLNQKKPVIFLEEYEEKPDFLSLNPMLPNEKPPVQGYGPRGGSPDGPESSTTASTEDDENAPLAPKSPKENRNGYNAPPPYSAR